MPVSPVHIPAWRPIRPLSTVLEGDENMSEEHRLSTIMKNGTVPARNKRRGESKTSKRTVEIEEKRQRALDLRRSGMNYREIAAAMDTSPSRAHDYVTSALKRIREQTDEIAEVVKVLELERLDSLFKTAYRAAMDGDVKAIDQALRCMDRRARLLGLDAPAKVAQTDSEGRDLIASVEFQAIRALVLENIPDPEARGLLAERLMVIGRAKGCDQPREVDPV